MIITISNKLIGRILLCIVIITCLIFTSYNIITYHTFTDNKGTFLYHLLFAISIHISLVSIGYIFILILFAIMRMHDNIDWLKKWSFNLNNKSLNKLK